MGADKDIVTVAFATKTKESAEDLASFIERGYTFVLDADATSGEQADGTYKVFVEIERDRRASEQIMELTDGVGKLTGMDDLKFRYYKNFRSLPMDQATLEANIPVSSDEYDLKITESVLNNYKKFLLTKSFVENVDMWDDILRIKKAYADPVFFKFVDIGPTQQTLDAINESFNPWDFAEIIFLSKYIGDYNITKYGNKLTFENNETTLVLERIIT